MLIKLAILANYNDGMVDCQGDSHRWLIQFTLATSPKKLCRNTSHEMNATMWIDIDQEIDLTLLRKYPAQPRYRTLVGPPSFIMIVY